MEQGPNWQQEKPQQDTGISHPRVCLACKSKANCSCVKSKEEVCTLSAGSTAKELQKAGLAIR